MLKGRTEQLAMDKKDKNDTLAGIRKDFPPKDLDQDVLLPHVQSTIGGQLSGCQMGACTDILFCLYVDALCQTVQPTLLSPSQTVPVSGSSSHNPCKVSFSHSVWTLSFVEW